MGVIERYRNILKCRKRFDSSTLASDRARLQRCFAAGLCMRRYLTLMPAALSTLAMLAISDFMSNPRRDHMPLPPVQRIRSPVTKDD